MTLIDGYLGARSCDEDLCCGAALTANSTLTNTSMTNATAP